MQSVRRRRLPTRTCTLPEGHLREDALISAHAGHCRNTPIKLDPVRIAVKGWLGQYLSTYQVGRHESPIRVIQYSRKRLRDLWNATLCGNQDTGVDRSSQSNRQSSRAASPLRIQSPRPGLPIEHRLAPRIRWRMFQSRRPDRVRAQRIRPLPRNSRGVLLVFVQPP